MDSLLNRINSISSRSNAGKTTLLEALLLLLGSGSSNLLINTNVNRRSNPLNAPTHAAFSTIWKPLFFELMIVEDIRIITRHSSHGSMELKISCKRPNGTEARLDKPVLTTIATDIN